MSKYRPKPVFVDELQPNSPLILSSPFISPLVFENNASDARDHCANERNFLSWLRLSMYLCIVSVAVVISFHFKHEPSELEKGLSLPLGICFWVLSLVCLFAGLGNYLKTIGMYSKKAALVQSGSKTQFVSCIHSRIFTKNPFVSRYFAPVPQIRSLRGTDEERSKWRHGSPPPGE